MIKIRGKGKLRKLKVLLIVCFFALLFGCRSGITEGEIYEKEFIPAHSTIELVPILSFNGENITTTYIPEIRNYPDAWYIRIKAVNDEDRVQEDEYSVTEEIFNQYNIGEFYSHRFE